MNYRDILNLFSMSQVGALVVSEDDIILDVNPIGCQLLHVEETVRGQRLEVVAPFFSQADASEIYGETAFGLYVKLCSVLIFDELPPRTRMLTFCDATGEFKLQLAENVLNHVSEAITIWDDNGRMLMLNDAAIQQEGHIAQNAIGRSVEDLFQTQNNSILVIPHILKHRQPVLNLRQDYITESGKELQIISNNYPIIKNGTVLGAVSIMEDYTKIDGLNRQIIDLQRKLINQSASTPAAKENILAANYSFRDIVYASEAMRTVVERCRQIAQSDSPVMIYGETGTGKELFAQSIHNESTRANGPFLAINCAAIPTTLLESILFGTERGAYTGAEKREGLFEQAHKGTLLLDEINSMDISLQSKLLRVLQEGSFRRVGGSKLIHVDVRVISNINLSPMEAIEKGILRKDLYYRLGVININIPALRERKEDILLLSKNFIINQNKKLLKNVRDLSNQTKDVLFAYDWPGNVRELQHAIEYAINIIPKEADQITTDYLPEHILAAIGRKEDDKQAESLEAVLQQAGYWFLWRSLKEHGGNISQTAKAMRITRQNLQHRMKKYGVHPEKLSPVKE